MCMCVYERLSLCVLGCSVYTLILFYFIFGVLVRVFHSFVFIVALDRLLLGSFVGPLNCFQFRISFFLLFFHLSLPFSLDVCYFFKLLFALLIIFLSVVHEYFVVVVVGFFLNIYFFVISYRN